MPSKNMLPKGKRRQSVRQDYRNARTIAAEQAAAARARVEAFEEEPAAPQLINTADMMEHEPTLEERVARNDWITTRGASGSKVAEETHEAPRYPNPYAKIMKEQNEPARKPAPVIQTLEDLEPEDGIRTLTVEPAAEGMRIDAFLAKALPDISRVRVQGLIAAGQVRINGEAAKSKLKLVGGETIEIEGEPKLEPIHATPEDIPLEMVYEDNDLAVINKPAGMMVHAGAGDGDSNRGTLVNALLHHMTEGLSQVGGDLRPGIVHRLDKQTSGLIVVAKNDSTHRKLSEMFADRHMRKVYLALVHGEVDGEEGSVKLPIARDLVRRVRMTTKRPGGRHAVSHWRVLERINGPYGKFTLVEVRIETGRTHQIRVHMQSMGHSVVGDFLYGAPHVIRPVGKGSTLPTVELERNFLHAAELDFQHPKTRKKLELRSPLPELLVQTMETLKGK